MEKKDLEMLAMAIIAIFGSMIAMLKVMTEKHGKLVDFQKVACYSYEMYHMPDGKFIVVKEPQLGGNLDEFKIEVCETEKEAKALFDEWADAGMGVKK